MNTTDMTQHQPDREAWAATLKQKLGALTELAYRDPVGTGEKALELLLQAVVVTTDGLLDVNTEDGALASSLDDFVVLIGNRHTAPIETRSRWMGRLHEACVRGIDAPVACLGPRWGDLCGCEVVAGEQADFLLARYRDYIPDFPLRPFPFLAGVLSTLNAAGRYETTLGCLEAHGCHGWAHRRYGFEAVLALSTPHRALAYAHLHCQDEERDDAIVDVLEILDTSGYGEDFTAACLDWLLPLDRDRLSRVTGVDDGTEVIKWDVLLDDHSRCPASEGRQLFTTLCTLNRLDLAYAIAVHYVIDPHTILEEATKRLETDQPLWAYRLLDLVHTKYEMGLSAGGDVALYDEIDFIRSLAAYRAGLVEDDGRVEVLYPVEPDTVACVQNGNHIYTEPFRIHT